MLTGVGNVGNKPETAVEIESTSNGSSERRRFGLFEVDVRAGELRRQGIKVKLQEQPFQILVHLLESAGEVVTRDELRQRLWPADTFVDFDHSLNAAIRRLRDALGDNAENPRFIETVARRGYRFLAPVSIDSARLNGIRAVTTSPAVTSSSSLRGIWWIAGAIAAVLLVGLGVFLGSRLQHREAAPLRMTHLTANPADDPVHAAAVSRDGKYLAYSDEEGFYLRQIETGETHSVALPAGMLATAVSWLPDGAHMIVNLRDASELSGLWELSAFGGELRKVLDDGELPAVSPDGRQLAFVAGKALRQRIWLANVDGTQLREVVGQDGDLFGGIAWSPDSRKIAYTTAKFGYGAGVEASIKALAVNDAQPKAATVLSVVDLQGPLSWGSDGRLIYGLAESRPRQMDSNLWAIKLDKNSKPEGPPERLSNDQGNIFTVSSSGDSKRIIYVKGVPEPDVYVARLDPAGSLGEPQRLTLDDREDLPFDWTADSRQVIFMSNRTGNFSIYKQALGQTVPDLLVAGTDQLEHPRLSPDGSQLLYVSYPNWGDNSYQVPLMRVPVTGGPPRQIVKANWINNHQCSRAPASICVYSVLEKNEIMFFKFDPVAGQPSLIYDIKDDLTQIYNWSLSPDGSTLAIARGKFGEGEDRVHLVSLNGGPERWLQIRGWPGLDSLDWAADSKSIWAVSAGGRENSLLNINLLGSVRVVWHPKKLRVGWAIPSRDGKSLALHVNSMSANVLMLERP
jgi:DNA-binding winged helix-turn-helix (wHTH) protein/Tol biopolymer transport system component